MLDRSYYVYIVTNRNHRVLYTGVTNNLTRRIFEHRNKSVDGFTARYHCAKLVYFETTESIEAAIAREKQIKAGPRRKKIALIDAGNPEWEDLAAPWLDSE